MQQMVQGQQMQVEVMQQLLVLPALDVSQLPESAGSV